MTSEGFFIDHVIYGVIDVDAAAERLRAEHGLGSVPGRVHLGGTNSRIVPLGPECFFELLGIEDTAKADGAWLADTLQGQDRVLWWCLGVSDLDDTAGRRGLPLRVGQARPDDRDSLTFRSAGMPRHPLPFFLSLIGERETRHRIQQERHRAANHTCAPTGYTFVEVGDHEQGRTTGSVGRSDPARGVLRSVQLSIYVLTDPRVADGDEAARVLA